LTDLDEPTRDPAVSPDGRRVAFSVGGRLGIVDVAGGPVRFVTLGTDWKDTSPAWLPDGHALVVAARHSDSLPRDIHLVTVESAGDPARRFLTDTAHLDESQPAVSLDGKSVVFVREDSLYRVDLPDGRPRRIAGGFRRVRSPRFLPNGRVLFLWMEGKDHGIDTIDLDGKGRETLSAGTTYYRTVAPSPDGQYLAATFTFDLAFHPLDALKLRQREELRLLDRHGTRLGELAGSWRHANHTADWGR
jgi:Tol biopolymer transport system component